MYCSPYKSKQTFYKSWQTGNKQVQSVSQSGMLSGFCRCTMCYTAVIQGGQLIYVNEPGGPYQHEHGCTKLFCDGCANVLNPPMETKSTQICPICQESMAERCHFLPCAHGYHDHCIRRWFETDRTCPTCRQSMDDLKAEANTVLQPHARYCPIVDSDGKVCSQRIYGDYATCMEHDFWYRVSDSIVTAVDTVSEAINASVRKHVSRYFLRNNRRVPARFSE